MADPIVLNDSVPVAHTFIPVGKDAKGVVRFEENGATVEDIPAIGYPWLTLNLTRPSAPTAGQSSTGRTIRVSAGLHVPVLAIGEEGAMLPKVESIDRAFVEFVISENSSKIRRENLLALLSELIGEEQFADQVENLVSVSY